MNPLERGAAVCAGVLIALSAGCVSQSRYDQAMDDTQRALEDADRQTSRARAQARELEHELNLAQASLEAQRGERMNLEVTKRALTASVDAENAKLDELASARAATARRAALFHDVASRLAHEVGTGALDVVERDGRLIIRLPDDELFDTGRAEIKPRGRKALQEVASVIRPIARGRHFEVAGHTDGAPIARGSPYASNWELSTARAVHVVELLLDDGVPRGALSAAGYADVDPVASNGTAEGRRRNRRTEVTLEPDVDEIVQMPASK